MQIKTKQEQNEVERSLPGWKCVSFGYVPYTEEDIYVFEKVFKSEIDWTEFLNSESTKKTIEMRDVTND